MTGAAKYTVLSNEGAVPPPAVSVSVLACTSSPRQTDPAAGTATVLFARTASDALAEVAAEPRASVRFVASHTMPEPERMSAGT